LERNAANYAPLTPVSFLRRARNPDDFVVVVCNFTPVARADYRIGVPAASGYREVLNSDSRLYGGSDVGNAQPPAINVSGSASSAIQRVPGLM